MPLETDVPGVRELLLGMAVQVHGKARLFQTLKESLTEPRLPAAFAFQERRRHLAGHAEAHDVRSVLRTRPQAPLVSGAVHKRLDLATALDIQRADALGRVKLVSCHGEKVNAKLVNPAPHLADALRGIGVERNITGGRDARELGKIGR